MVKKRHVFFSTVLSSTDWFYLSYSKGYCNPAIFPAFQHHWLPCSLESGRTFHNFQQGWWHQPGSLGTRLDPLIFSPGAQCVEPVWSMSKEEFEESQRQAWLLTGRKMEQKCGNRSCFKQNPYTVPSIYARWWFQIFFIFTPIWGRFPFWLTFFKWVETTN